MCLPKHAILISAAMKAALYILSVYFRCGAEARTASSFGGLFEAVRQLQQHRLAVGASEEGNAHRKAAHESGRNRDVRITGDGRRRGASGQAASIPQYKIVERRGRAGWRDDCLYFVFRDHRIDALGARETNAFRAGIE